MWYQAKTLSHKWVGRQIYGSTDNRLNVAERHPRPITKVWHDPVNGTFCATAREQHQCYDAQALDTLLESLAVPTA